jgi:branched-chain amino acid aminotransferase
MTSCPEGITRASLSSWREIKVPAIERRITRDEVYCVTRPFTGTAAEVTPIRELDNRRIGSGERGPITERLQAMFFDCVNGKAEKHASWLTHV